MALQYKPRSNLHDPKLQEFKILILLHFRLTKKIFISLLQLSLSENIAIKILINFKSRNQTGYIKVTKM